MTKNNKILIGIISFLVIILVVFGIINKDGLVEKQELNNDAVFAVLDDGVEVATYNMEEIMALGENTFKANLKTSGEDPVEHEYSGVLLKKIFEDAGISFDDRTNVTVKAIDGYVVAVSMEKFLEDDNVYLAYKRDGEWIGNREDGGKGPYQMIISKDKFSQYWCKWAYSAELN